MTRHVVLTFPHALGVPGGGPVHCRRLAMSLRQADVEVTLLPVESLTLSMWPRPVPPLEMRSGGVVDRLSEAGVDILPLPQSAVGWWFDGIGVRRKLEGILDRRPVDGVLGWWGELAYSTRLLASRKVFSGILAAAPYSLWWSRQTSQPLWLHRGMDQLLLARTARRVSRIFANSAYTASEVSTLLGADPRRIEIVNPPVSSRFVKRNRILSGRIERLIFFGRLQAEKGIFDLIEALGRLETERWQLRVAGSGDADGVVRAAREQGIMDRVTMLGRLEPAQLVEALDWAQLAILPSHEESFGLSVAEAQLAGLPVVAYDAGAVGEIADDGQSGWLVPVGRIDRLATAIRHALTDPEETRRRAIRARDRTQRLLLESPAEKILRSIDSWRQTLGPHQEGTAQ